MKAFFAIFVFIVAHFTCYSQEMLGVVNSNYAGIYGISLNPSGMVGSKLYMDYNLFSLNSSFGNNYMYLERDDYLDYLFHGTLPIYYTSENEERNYTIYRGKDYYSGYYSNRIAGPAAMIVAGKHAFGLSTALRSNISFHNVSQDIAYFLYEAIDYNVQHGIEYSLDKRMQIGSLGWVEVNFSYAYNFHRYRWESWSAGITIRPLLGYLGFYSNIDNLNYIVQNDSMATVHNTSFDYAYSIPVDYNDNQFPQSPIIRGFGWGIDLGITYAKTTKGHSTRVFSRLCEQQYEAYNYKLGISLLDLGYIRFSKGAELTTLTNTNTEWFEPDDTLSYGSVNEINAKIDYYFLENSEEVTKKNEFVMNTPAAISIQFDYMIKKYFFLNGTLIYGFSIGQSYVKRPSVLAITPRFETARFEVSLPVSIYEWYGIPRIGLAFRYGNFFLGFDKINTLIGIGDFTGFDFYIGLRLNLTNNLRMNYIKGNCGNQRLRNIETFDFRNF
jgi:hypothetical protein